MDSDPDCDVPPELLEDPDGGYPAPLPLTAQQTLPFHLLGWVDFERLCLRIARQKGELGKARLYGSAGQLQYGIDFYVVLPSGGYDTYQCKRVQTLTASIVKEAADEFVRRRRWVNRSEKFTLCTSDSARDTKVLEAIETHRKRLRKRKRPVEFEVWDAEELAQILEDHEQVVKKFFGPIHTAAFFGRTYEPEGSKYELLRELIQRTGTRTQFVTNDWEGERLRELLEALRENDPDNYARLNDQVGSPPDDRLVRAAIEAPTQWLREAPPTVWDVLARTAESKGDWSSASLAWQALSDREGSVSGRAGALVSGAVAAKMANDEDRYEQLIERAGELDERHPRLVLQGMSETMPPAEQLEILKDLDSDDVDDRAQILARKAMAELLMPNIEASRRWVEQVEELLPDSILAASLRVSLTAQIGRLSVLAHRTLEHAVLQHAAETAERTRQRLLAQRRYSEATRLVMLKADIFALLGQREEASRILRHARPEEQESTEQKEVLASSAAERALDWKLARAILSEAEDTPTVARLRLEIDEAIGSPAERESALTGLDRIVAEGGSEAPNAAFVRLAATLGSKKTPWSGSAADYLKQNGHERAAFQAEAFYRSERDGYDAGLAVISSQPAEPWVLATRLRLALAPNAPNGTAEKAAEELLAIGPSHAARVEAAQGLARAKNLERARTELIEVARDVNAPTAARADAFEALMHVIGNDLGEWHLASTFHHEWVTVAPTDDRSSKWAPRIANRRTQHSEDAAAG